MAIDPVRSSGPGAAGANPSQTNATSGAAADTARTGDQRAASSASETGDTIELSTASLELHAQGAAASVVPSATMTAEQLRAAAGRVASGYYDQPDVRSALAQRLAESGDM